MGSDVKEAKAIQFVDGYDNFLSRVGVNNDNSISGGLYTFNYKTRNRMQLEAAYRGSWIVGAVIDSVAEDMTRAGIDISTNEGEEDIKDFTAAMSRLRIWESYRDNTKWARLYGGSIGVMEIEGQDYATPLRIETIAKNQFKGIAVYDRWQLNPDLTELIKTGPDIGLPEYYYIVTTASTTTPSAPSATGQVKVHHSRCIPEIGIKLPFFQAITEMMWGESILERLWDRLIAFDNVTMSAASLVDRANLRTVKIKGLREIVAAGGKAQDGLVAQFEMMRLMQVNEGLTLLDFEDEFASTSYSFAGLSDIMLQFGQQLSGATGIPLIRLFAQSPSGMGATGDADIRMYYDNINAQQESRYRPSLGTVIKVLWQSTFGRPSPKDLEYTFTPLWQMSALDKATIAKSNTETVIGASEAGLISQKSAMQDLRQMSGDTGLFSNITDEDIDKADEELPPVPEDTPVDEPGKNPEDDENPKPDEKPPVKNLDGAGAKVKRFFGMNNDAAFKESDHPRKDDGKFGNGGGGGSVGKSRSESSGSTKQKKAAKPTAEQAVAIRNYTGALSTQFIEADRGRDVDPEIKKKNELVNEYLAKAPKFEGDIYRGIVVEKSEAEAILAKYKEGETVESDAKQSWTKNQEAIEQRLISVSKEKKAPVKIMFEYPKSEAGVDVSAESRFPEEEEVVLPKKSAYVVSKVEKTKDGYRVIMKANSK